jgi:cobyrinic acid a,c-diamide synthase
MPPRRAEVPRIVIAGAASGVGKTTLTIALTRALRARGITVAPFKCGPDYLDPTYHARAAGKPSQNLDGWMMGSDSVRATFVRAARGAQVAIIEGVMGLFDGESPTGEAGSTAQIAKWLEAPVVLAVDAAGMARSAAALYRGFATFDPELRLGGALFNRVGSAGHLDLLRKALGPELSLGGLPREPSQSFPERHLGLLAADDETIPESLLDAWGATAEAWIDVDRVLALARSAPSIALVGEEAAVKPSPSARRCRLGVAQDDAFHFYYEDNLRRLEASGATLVRFSPIGDAALPDVDGIYLGGGYPEAHAPELATNESMRASVRDFARRGGPIYAECGGLMYLTRSIETLDGCRHDMVGLVPGTAVMRDRLQALGYVETETQSRTLLGPPGTRFRGHQFRYSELVLSRDDAHPVDLVYSVRKRRGDQSSLEGYRIGNVLASYVHAHWASNPSIPDEIVRACLRFAEARAAENRH